MPGPNPDPPDHGSLPPGSHVPDPGVLRRRLHDVVRDIAGSVLGRPETPEEPELEIAYDVVRSNLVDQLINMVSGQDRRSKGQPADQQAFAAKTGDATRERPYAHHTMSEVVESMFIHGGGIEGHTVMGCAAYDEIRRRLNSLGHEPSGYATLSDIAFVQLLRWAADQRQGVMADLAQEAARRIDMMREPREQSADLDESLRVIEEVLTRDQVPPTDLQEVLTHIQHIDHQVRYLLDRAIGEDGQSSVSFDQAVFTGRTPDCPMCGAPSEYTALIYSNRQDERRLLCTECLLLMGAEEGVGDDE